MDDHHVRGAGVLDNRVDIEAQTDRHACHGQGVGEEREVKTGKDRLAQVRHEQEHRRDDPQDHVLLLVVGLGMLDVLSDRLDRVHCLQHLCRATRRRRVNLNDVYSAVIASLSRDHVHVGRQDLDGQVCESVAGGGENSGRVVHSDVVGRDRHGVPRERPRVAGCTALFIGTRGALCLCPVLDPCGVDAVDVQQHGVEAVGILERLSYVHGTIVRGGQDRPCVIVYGFILHSFTEEK